MGLVHSRYTLPSRHRNDHDAYQSARLGVEPFHWRWCQKCKEKGYRDQFNRGYMKWTTLPTWEAVNKWHDRIDREMWEDFLGSQNRSKPNEKT